MKIIHFNKHIEHYRIQVILEENMVYNHINKLIELFSDFIEKIYNYNVYGHLNDR